MELVIDANSFIAGFLRDSKSRLIILSSKVQLYCPDWLEQEFNRNEKELIKKFSEKNNFSETKNILLRFINLVPHGEYSRFLEEASKLTAHSKDVPYFALSLKLRCPIWSNEKSFKLQSKVRVHNTADLIRELGL